MSATKYVSIIRAWSVQRTIAGWVLTKSVEDEGPYHGVSHGLLELVSLEMLITDPLLVDADALDGHEALILRQELGVELVVGHNPEEEHADGGGEEADYEEEQLPGLDG
jgi:hypothetical protein